MRQMMRVHQTSDSIRPLLEGAIAEVVEGLRLSGMLCGGVWQGPDGGGAPPLPAPLITHEIRDGEARLLRSRVGAKWQRFVHGDRSPEFAMEGGGFCKMHYSAMAALMEDTGLWVKPIGSQELVYRAIPKGCVGVWRGDVGHGGDAHPGGNARGHYRLFLHVDAKRGDVIGTVNGEEALFPIRYSRRRPLEC